MKRILVATDFSDATSASLELARELAGRFGAELVLFHAHQVPAYLHTDGLFSMPSSITDELERSVVAELRRLADRLRVQGHAVEIRHAIGAPAVEICRAAAEVHADLIVIGTHGATGLRHVLLGSVADKVIRTAPCPVLTVHPLEAAAHAP